MRLLLSLLSIGFAKKRSCLISMSAAGAAQFVFGQMI
jgi:hypothetical protein